MSDLMELARRCETEEPSRELDQAIIVALGWTPFKQYWMAYSPHYGEPAPIPRYTTSLDAAVTLVPTPMKWAVGTHGVRATKYAAKVAHDGYTAKADWPSYKGKTPALALCAAALRARASVEGQRPGSKPDARGDER